MFPIIIAEGTPYEIGFAHGSKAKAQVHQSIASYREMFYDYAGLCWDTAKTAALGYLPAITDYDPDLAEELRGVADGAEVELTEILALNARSELALQYSAPQDGCTSLAVCPERSLSGHTLIGQNWDWKPSQRAACILLKIRQQNKPDILMVTEAGIIGKIGLNSAGIGLCFNALATSAPPTGVPIHIALRGILNAEKLSEVVEAVGLKKLGCAVNILAAHKNGEAIDIESGAGEFDVLYAEDGTLCHTNHFTAPRMNHIKDTFKLVMPDTFVRLGRIRKLVRGRDMIGIPDIMAFFSDHVEYPDSICRHDDPKDAPGKRLGTVFSVIMDLGEGRMLLCAGEPCNTAYEAFSL